MPYIEPGTREQIDNFVDKMDHAVYTSGDLNYAITKLTLRFITNRGLSYSTLAAVMGTLRLVAVEIEQRIVRSYENMKMNQNGDIPEFQSLISTSPEKTDG